MSIRRPGATEPSPLRELPIELARQVRVVLTDIDDTLTTGGRLESGTYAALERLAQAGMKVIPITGRSAGWCDLIARFWPVAGVVGENGAFFYRYDHVGRRMVRRYVDSESERADKRVRLKVLVEQVLREVPGAALAADHAFRECDVAVDHCEDLPRALDASAIERIVALFESGGATAKVSSIHVNAWIGNYDKLEMTARVLAEDFRVDVAGPKVAFIGDSPNDAPMFAAVPFSVGVANVAPYLLRLNTAPSFVCDQAGGAGFREFADYLLDAR